LASVARPESYASSRRPNSQATPRAVRRPLRPHLRADRCSPIRPPKAASWRARPLARTEASAIRADVVLGTHTVGGSEANPVTAAVELPFQDGDLVAQGQDLHVPCTVAHRKQPEHRQPVRHGQVRQSKQHNKASSPIAEP